MQEDFAKILNLIKTARLNALQTVNTQLVVLYWQVGKIISFKLKQSGWGEGVVAQLAIDIEKNAPEIKGFNKRGLYRMVQFFETWSALKETELMPAFLEREMGNVPDFGLQLIDNQFQIVSSAMTQLEEAQLLARLVKISWTHHLELISRTKTPEERVFYLGLTLKEAYTVKELGRQISSSLYERYVLSQGKMALPSHPKSELVPEIFRNHYVFEFLNLPEPFDEHDLQKGLLREIKNFILELGRDFIFIAEEFKVQVGTRDFRIDLLFFHRDLQCLVAFDLKMGVFEPEYLGKMGFYLEALDRDVKKPHENPSIGILLCKTPETEVVEYAMSRNISPALVAEYELKLPDKKFLQEKIHGLLR